MFESNNLTKLRSLDTFYLRWLENTSKNIYWCVPLTGNSFLLNPYSSLTVFIKKNLNISACSHSTSIILIYFESTQADQVESLSINLRRQINLKFFHFKSHELKAITFPVPEHSILNIHTQDCTHDCTDLWITQFFLCYGTLKITI